MNILLTGGAGYIGSHTIIELDKAGHSVVVVDNLVNSNPESLRRVAKIIGKVLPVEEYIRAYEKENFRLPEFTAGNAVNTLKELSEHERCSPPVYESNGPDALGYDKNGKPIWACSCDVISEGIRKCVFAHSKKEGKKYAAYLVLCDMFELPNEYGPSKRLNVWGFNGKELTPSPSNEYLKDF